MQRSLQFCVQPSLGSAVMAVWESDMVIDPELVKWIVATRMAYSLRDQHCTAIEYSVNLCGGSAIYHLDGRSTALTEEMLRKMARGSADDTIAAIMTIDVVIVREEAPPIVDSRRASPGEGHQEAAQAALEELVKQLH